ncbi:MAG: HAD family hydrolase [Pseudomonadota bacterium]
MRIAMWSGPRNLSTAMMYAFASRPDTSVIDEPFYSAYLKATGLKHPMADEILASQPVDPNTVVDTLLGRIPNGQSVFYQKHMTQHMIDGMPRGWMTSVKNVFLIRHPARVVASFSAKYENPTVDDLGFTQQLELFRQVADLGERPLVVDSTDIRHDPETMLRLLCNSLGLSWTPAMLSWKSGGHPADGVWAKHWYGGVHASTGFAKAEGALPQLSVDKRALVDQVMPAYEELRSYKISAN